eukprot:scaffold12560_cov17-Tisochrysis_lutea.AAC.2
MHLTCIFLCSFTGRCTVRAWLASGLFLCVNCFAAFPVEVVNFAGAEEAVGKPGNLLIVYRVFRCVVLGTKRECLCKISHKACRDRDSFPLDCAPYPTAKLVFKFQTLPSPPAVSFTHEVAAFGMPSTKAAPGNTRLSTSSGLLCCFAIAK